MKEWMLRTLSSKFPRVESLSIDNFRLRSMEIAKVFCERDENGNQIFPYLHSWHLCYSGDTLHQEGKDVAYFLANRDGIETFKRLSLGSHSNGDSTALSDLQLKMWETCAFPPPHNNQSKVNHQSSIPRLVIGLLVAERAQGFLDSIAKMNKNNRRLFVNCHGLPKEDLVHAFNSFPDLANVQLQYVEFPLGDLPVPPTLKKLLIHTTSKLQLVPSLELLSTKASQITLQGTER